MSKIKFIFAILMFTFAVNAQQKDGSFFTNEESNRTPALMIEGGAAEFNVSFAAYDFNKQGARKAMVERDYRAAAELFAKAYESDARCFMCRFNLAQALTNLQKLDEAVKIFDELIAAHPQFANAYAGLGEALDKKQLYDESVVAYQKAVSLAPNDAVLQTNLGNALYRVGKYKQSLVHLDQAVKLAPDLAVAQSNRGTTLFRLGQLEEAAKCLRRAVALIPAAPEAQNNLGVVLDAIGKHKEARKYYLESIRLNPNYDSARYNLALNYLEDDKREAAREHLDVLQNLDAEMATNLRKIFNQKFIINVADRTP